MKPLAPLAALVCIACGAQPQPAPLDPLPEPEPAPAYEHQFAPPPQQLFRAGGGGTGALKGTWYTVKKGDFISAIASRHGVPTEDLIEINGLAHPEKLEVGQKLFLVNVDRPRGPRVRDAGSGAAQQTRPRAEVKTRQRRVPFIWPVRTGTTVSYFGKRGKQMHKGIDIKAPLRTKIYAVAEGTVIYSNNTQPGYGNLIIIRHARDVVSVYAHNNKNLVDEGDRVRQGQEIAEVGQTGRTKTPHLHFELRVKGKAQNPLTRLPATRRIKR